MRAGTAEMPEDVGVVAPGFFQGIGKDGEAVGIEFARWKGALIVGELSEGEYGRDEPVGVDGDGAEGISDDLTEEFNLNLAFSSYQRVIGNALCKHHNKTLSS